MQAPLVALGILGCPWDPLVALGLPWPAMLYQLCIICLHKSVKMGTASEKMTDVCGKVNNVKCS